MRKLLKPPAGLFLLVGLCVLILLFVPRDDGFLGSFYVWAAVTLGLIAGSWLVVTWHEMGHVVGALIVGMPVTTMVFYPFRIQRAVDGRYHLHLIRQRDAVSGMVMALPDEPQVIRWKQIVLIGGGPLASLILAIVGAVALVNRVSVMMAEGRGSFAVAFLAMVTGLSLLEVIVTWLRRYTFQGLLMTDGALLKMLLRGGAPYERYAVMVQITRAARDGARPREFKREWIDTVTALQDGTPEEVKAQQMAVLWALDRHDLERAHQHVERYGLIYQAASLGRKRVLLGWFKWLVNVAAYEGGLLRGDSLAARQWYDALRFSPDVKPEDLRFTEAIVRLLEGDSLVAGQLAREGLAELEKKYGDELPPFAGAYQMDRDLWRTIIDRAEKAVSTAEMHPSRNVSLGDEPNTPAQNEF